MEHRQHEAQILPFSTLKDLNAESRPTVDVEDFHQIHALSLRLAVSRSLADVLSDVLKTAVRLTEARLGTSQLIAPDGGLAIVSEVGFGEAIKSAFPIVKLGDCSVCAAALKAKKRIAVPDLRVDPGFSEIAAALRSHGAVSVASTPVLDRAGSVLAMFSVYWLEEHELSDRDIKVLDLCAELAGRHVERAAADEAFRKVEADFNARQSLLMRELSHRGKNLVSVIQAIAARTLSGHRSLDEAREIFVGRLTALAATYNTLTEESPSSAKLHDIVGSCLSSHIDQADIAGPTVEIPAKTAQTLGLVFHELATNALKYGALSVASGHVEVRWGNTGWGGEHFYLEWTERGGPGVEPPERKGFGSRIITSIIGSELGCTPTLAYDAAGLRYRLECPVASLE